MGNKKPTTSPAAIPVTVVTTLKAEWPLKSASHEEMLLLSHDLHNKMVELSKASKPAKTLTPAEEEIAEEMGSADMPPQYDDGSPKPGEPVLIFVRKITDEEHAKATAEAFAKAKQDAARLAKAAGAELGALRSLTRQSGPDMQQYNEGGYDPYRRQYMYMMQQQNASEDHAHEAIGDVPGAVKTVVTVSATFAVK